MARYQVTKSDHSGRLSIVFPSKKSFVLLFLALWLIGWYHGMLSWFETMGSAEQSMNESGSEGSLLFLYVWGVFWAAGGVLVLLQIAWGLGGSETLAVHSLGISLRKDILGIPLGREKNYRWDNISDIREHKIQRGILLFRQPQYGFLGSPGRLAFDYGGKSITFATGLKKEDISVVLNTIINSNFARSLASRD